MARQRGDRWQADVWVGDKRIRKSFRTEAEAVAYEAKMEGAEDVATTITLGPYIDEQFDALWGNSKAPETNRINCNVLVRHLGADTLIEEITEIKVDAMIATMRKAGLKNGTINRKLSTLSRILKQAVRHRIITARPDIKFQEEAGGRDYALTREQENASREFFEHIGQPLSGALFDFLLYTGCRLGEAMKLTRSSEVDGGILFADRKSKKVKAVNTVVPLVGPAVDGWRNACRLSNHAKPFGEALPRKTFYGHWHLLKDHLGLQEEEAFVPHILRHTCCTRLVKGGVPLPKVMKWMGHRNIQTTMGYAYLIPKDLDDAADVLLRAN